MSSYFQSGAGRLIFVKIIRWILRLVLPVVVLYGAWLGAQRFLQDKVQAKQQPRPEAKLLVETQPVASTAQRLKVSAQGSVVIAQQAVILPQVSGRIVSLHPKLAQGGQIAAGEELFSIEARDYELALSERKTALAEARSNLDIEQGQQRVAKREWEVFQAQVSAAEEAAASGENKDIAAPESSLALRKPQLQRAQSLVNAAKVRVDRAQVDLARTKVVAPFNGVVQAEEVELGQVVGPTSRAVVLVGTDAFWVQALIPPDQLRMFSIPGINATEGAKVKVWQDLGGDARAEWEGRVLRVLTDLDPMGRMAKVLVEVKDPLNLRQDTTQTLPLMLGAFVNIEIESNREEVLVTLPRKALRDGERALVLKEDNTLDIRSVEVVWRYEDTVLVRSGVKSGEEVITSAVSAPIQGMALRKAGAPTKNPAQDPTKNPAEDSAQDLTKNPAKESALVPVVPRSAP